MGVAVSGIAVGGCAVGAATTWVAVAAGGWAVATAGAGAAIGVQLVNDWRIRVSKSKLMMTLRFTAILQVVFCMNRTNAK